MQYKVIVMTFILTVLVVSLFFFGVLFYNDPLKIFHKPWKYEKYLQRNMRSQAAGIINNWEYDSIILGTSMLENTSAKEASDTLGGKFINISLSGSDFFERSIVLSYALKKKQIRKVIYSLDDEGLVEARKSAPSYRLEKWAYLYDNNPFNDFKVYINNSFIKCLFSTSSKKQCMGFRVDLDRPNAWYKWRKDKFGGVDNWFKQKLTPRIVQYLEPISTAIHEKINSDVVMDKQLYHHIKMLHNYLDSYLLALVKQYPQTEFIFILPPYSMAKYAIDAQHHAPLFYRYKEAIQYLVQQSSNYANMNIYAWGNEDFVRQLENYKDLRHYHVRQNTWMLKQIKSHDGLLTPQNVELYISEFTKYALEYNLTILGDKLEKYIHPE